MAKNLVLLVPVPPGPLGARFPRITRWLLQTAGSMSGGERKILGAVRIMLSPAKPVVLDEPSEGVQTENIVHMQTIFAEAHACGIACILLELTITMIEALVYTIIVLDRGGVVYRGRGDQISRTAMLEVISL